MRSDAEANPAGKNPFGGQFRPANVKMNRDQQNSIDVANADGLINTAKGVAHVLGGIGGRRFENDVGLRHPVVRRSFRHFHGFVRPQAGIVSTREQKFRCKAGFIELDRAL
jgi:hypothetical protein